MADILIRNIGRLITPLQKERDNPVRPLQKFPQAAILIQDGLIAQVGNEPDVLRKAPREIATLDAKGALALPGLVDCHTHPVFVGNRAVEFHLRNAGKSYLEIAAAGGGIAASARLVREAETSQIIEESLPRFRRSLMNGVTTIEGKSGYGLEWVGERKLLEVLIEIEHLIPQRLHRTFLVHAFPESYQNCREEFISDVCSRMIPAVTQEQLASTVDVFCETGAFSVEESRRLFQTARAAGLRCAVHANQFGHSGGALLAAEIKAESANHLEYLNEEEMSALAGAGTIAVVLPACVFFLGTIPYPPVRQMMEHGLRVAVATDMNPGSSMTESLPFCMTAAAIYCKMSPAELLWGATLDAARALGAEREVGSLESGKFGDVSLWNVPDLESLSYHFGNMRAAMVVIGGEIVWEDSDAAARY